jgi:hypothetical protein
MDASDPQASVPVRRAEKNDGRDEDELVGEEYRSGQVSLRSNDENNAVGRQKGRQSEGAEDGGGSNVDTVSVTRF